MKQPHRRNWRWLWAAVLLVTGGVFAWQHWQQARPNEERYRTQNVQYADVVQTVSATGTLNPVRVVSVGTQVSGTVAKLYVDFNDRVQQGQILLELDPELTNAQLRQSEAALSSARAKLVLAEAKAKRMQGLFAQGYIAQQELDEVLADAAANRAAVAQVQGQVDRDRVNVANTLIRAPVNGLVIDRQIDVGQTVAASFQTPTLIKIAQDLTRMQINASFAEADLGKLQEGLAVSFRVDAFPEQTWQGTVRQIRLNPTVQQNVVTYDVVIDVANPEQRLLPGMTAYVDIALAKRQQVLTVPNAALRFRPDNATKVANNNSERPRPANSNRQTAESGRRGTVYVWEQEQLRPIKLRLGLSDGKQTEVLAGDLKVGTAVVVADGQASKGEMNATTMRRF